MPLPYRLTGEFVFIVVLGLVGIAAAIRAQAYGITADGQLGPGAFPMTIGMLLAMVCAGLAVGHLRRVQASRPAPSPSRSPGTADPHPTPDLPESATTGSPRKAFLLLGMLAVAVAIAPLVGLIVSITAFILTVGLAVEGLGAVRSLALAAVAGGLFFVVFDLVLEIPLPGPW